MTSIPTRWLFLLGALIAIGPLSIDMYLPGFPLIEKSLGGHTGTAEFTLASFFIGLALGQLFYGPLSDRFGRRKPLLAGLVLYLIASVGCSQADSIPALAIWRFFQAFGGCAGMVITRAIVRDRCATREAARAFSMLMLVMGLAPILAPTLGGWVVGALDWRAVFALLAVFSLLCLAAVQFGLQETHDISHATPLRLAGILSDFRHLFANRAFLGYTLSGGLAMSGMFAYIAGSPFVLMELYGIPARHYGWIFGVNAFGLIAASQFNARNLKNCPPTLLLRRALWTPALAGTSLVVLGLVGWLPLPLLMAGFFMFVASLGYINPNSSAAALATHGQQAGTASALMGSIQFSLATLAGTLVGLLHDGTARPLVSVMAFCGVAAWLAHRKLVAPLES
ncbi:MAG: Bcr/CflA family multidrug efflux MFS transporter [Sulfuricella sp.]|nr:Bcr/CflA family multidrug efflux MFS transporter [Sulfuricella sp.]